MRTIQHAINSVCEHVAIKTSPFVQSRIGKSFLSIVLVGPLTFIPTVYTVWTAPNIDAFRTLTWPLMIIVNISASLSIIHNGDWQMRLVQIIWIFMVASVFLATIIR